MSTLAGKEPAAWGAPQFPDLKAEVEQLGLGEWVRWIGPIDEADKPGVLRMAVKRNAPLGKSLEGVFVPVVAMDVCQQYRVDAFPKRRRHRETAGERARPKAEVDQQAEPFGFEEAAVAAAAAAQHVKVDRHRAIIV